MRNNYGISEKEEITLVSDFPFTGFFSCVQEPRRTQKEMGSIPSPKQANGVSENQKRISRSQINELNAAQKLSEVCPLTWKQEYLF